MVKEGKRNFPQPEPKTDEPLFTFTTRKPIKKDATIDFGGGWGNAGVYCPRGMTAPQS